MPTWKDAFEKSDSSEFKRIFGVRTGTNKNVRILRTEGIEESLRHNLTIGGKPIYVPCAGPECSNIKLPNGANLHSYPGVLYGGSWGWSYDDNAPAVLWFPMTRVWNSLFTYLKTMIEKGLTSETDPSKLVTQCMLMISVPTRGQYTVQPLAVPPSPTYAEMMSMIEPIRDKLEADLRVSSVSLIAAILARKGVQIATVSDFQSGIGKDAFQGPSATSPFEGGDINPLGGPGSALGSQTETEGVKDPFASMGPGNPVGLSGAQNTPSGKDAISQLGGGLPNPFANLGG